MKRLSPQDRAHVLAVTLSVLVASVLACFDWRDGQPQGATDKAPGNLPFVQDSSDEGLELKLLLHRDLFSPQSARERRD